MLGPYGGGNFALGRDYRADRGGFGMNRRTWEFGQQIGRTVKRKYKELVRDSKAKPSKRAKRQAKSGGVVGEQIPTGGGDSRSSFYMAKKIRHPLGKLNLTAQSIVNNFSSRVETLPGQQGCANIGSYYTDADVNLHFTLANTSASAKVFLKSVHGESLITNQVNCNARIVIYDILARRDGATSANDAFIAFTEGFLDNTNGTVDDFRVPGVTPYMNPRFVQWFKILKTTNVILSPGACHSHVVHYRPNRLFSHEVSRATTASAIAGLSLFSLMVWHGTPINDLTTQTQVTLSPISLDIVQKECYLFSYAAVNNGVTDINQSLPTAFTVAGATMQDDGVELPFNEA